MGFKIFIAIILLAIFISLGSALFFLLTNKPGSTKVVKALTLRISLSLMLFFFLLLAFAMGWITPHGLT